MEKKTDLGSGVLLFNQFRQEHQLIIMDPNNVVFFNHILDCFEKLIINLFICFPVLDPVLRCIRKIMK